MSEKDFTVDERPNKLPIKLLLAGAGLFIVVWLGLKTWRLTSAAQSLLAVQSEANALIEDGLGKVDPEAAEALILGARSDVLVIKKELRPFLPLTPFLGWVPKFGPLLINANPLLEMADAGTEAAGYAIRGLKPGLELLQAENDGSTERLSQMVQILDNAAPDLGQASISFDRLVQSRNRLVEEDSMPWTARNLLSKADEWLPLGQESLMLANVLPEMMGIREQRRYLIIAQNEDELRPTGGFISGVGLLVVENGRILDLSFVDAYQVDDLRNKPYQFPPQPLYDFMGLELFLFRDANFWPDFPTSAAALMELYTYGQGGPKLDGVVAVDQRFVQMILEATGPVNVSTSEEAINSSNVVDAFRNAWAFQGSPDSADWSEWYLNRKAFIGTFAAALRQKIEQEFGSLDPALLLRNTFRAAHEKHLQVYLRQPELGHLFTDLGWDGRIQPAAGQDFVLLVDANVGYSKANALVAREINYQAVLNPDGSASAELTVTHIHNGEPSIDPCRQDISYAVTEVTDYFNFVDRCYWNYLRAYTPAGSQLITSTSHDIDAETMIAGQGWHGTANVIDEHVGTSTFALGVLVPRGQAVSSRFSYSLPLVAETLADDSFSYRLRVQKQAGMSPEPTSITIELPVGLEFLSSTPVPTKVNGQTVVFEFSLVSDTTIVVNYR